MFTDAASVCALISVPARTLVAPVGVKFLPLRLRTIGLAGAPPLPPAPPGPPRPAPGAPGPAGAPGPPGPPRPPAPPAFIVRRPKSPLHTAAFQVGSILQSLSVDAAAI